MKKGILTGFIGVTICLVVLVMGANVSFAAIDYGMEAYYKFNEGTGALLHDYSPNQFNGYINNAVWGMGPVNGYSLRLNGSSGNIDATSAISTLENMPYGSISVWFYYHGIPAGNAISPILYIGENGHNNFLVIEVGHNDVTNEKLYFTLAAYGNLILCFDSNNNLTRDRWYHFVAVVGPNGNTGYLNGQEMLDRHYNYGNASTVKFLSDVPVVDMFLLGRGTTLPAKSNSSFFTFYGAVGETRIYNRPLSAAEVLELYNLR